MYTDVIWESTMGRCVGDDKPRDGVLLKCEEGHKLLSECATICLGTSECEAFELHKSNVGECCIFKSGSKGDESSSNYNCRKKRIGNGT